SQCGQSLSGSAWRFSSQVIIIFVVYTGIGSGLSMPVRGLKIWICRDYGFIRLITFISSSTMAVFSSTIPSFQTLDFYLDLN
ncbi:MAG: hypothetical protein ABR534_16885, partial [Desulfotignum sp.]